MDSVVSDADILLSESHAVSIRNSKAYQSDLIIQDDAGGGRNSGFMYTRPTNATKVS